MADSVTIEMLLEAGERVVKRLRAPALAEVSQDRRHALSLVGAAPRGLSTGSLGQTSAPRGLGRSGLRRAKSSGSKGF